MSAKKRTKPAWLTDLSVCPDVNIVLHEEKYFMCLQYMRFSLLNITKVLTHEIIFSIENICGEWTAGQNEPNPHG